jgi:CBS domain-containing protein
MTATAPLNNRGATPESAGIRVSDAMHHGVLTCTRDTSLVEVAKVMARRRVHCVVVTADEGRDPMSLWGIVSDLDLVAASSVRNLAEQSAGGTATTAPLTVAVDETVQRAAQLMTEHGVSHLVVVDPRQRPVGVISTLDIASVLGQQ